MTGPDSPLGDERNQAAVVRHHRLFGSVLSDFRRGRRAQGQALSYTLASAGPRSSANPIAWYRASVTRVGRCFANCWLTAAPRTAEFRLQRCNFDGEIWNVATTVARVLVIDRHHSTRQNGTSSG